MKYFISRAFKKKIPGSAVYGCFDLTNKCFTIKRFPANPDRKKMDCQNEKRPMGTSKLFLSLCDKYQII